MSEAEKIFQKQTSKPKKLWFILSVSLIALVLVLVGVSVIRAWPLTFGQEWVDLADADSIPTPPPNEVIEPPDNAVPGPDEDGQLQGTGDEPQNDEPQDQDDKPDIDDQPPDADNQLLPVEKVSIFEITASSTLTDSSGEFSYFPGNAFDKDNTTAWVESVQGNGVGEWINFEFLKAGQIKGLKIFPGYAADRDVYFKNGRLKKIKIEFSNDPALEFDLVDEYALQEISFAPVLTDYIKIIIQDIWPGTKFNDTCLAEVEFIQ